MLKKAQARLIKTQLTLQSTEGVAVHSDNMQWVGIGKVSHKLKFSAAVWNVSEKVRNYADASKRQMWLEGVIKEKSLKNRSYME